MPIADLRSHDVAGYETLVRWRRTDGTVLEPAAFLPSVEASPLVCDLDIEMLRQSLRILEGLPAGQFLSVNVTGRTLAAPECPQRMHRMITDSGIDARRPHLEATETSLLAASTPVREAMTLLASTGARWYVDDFGTGYSSISHLRDLPISGLKLDASFTAGVARGDETSIRLAQALAGLSQGLGLETVAEGVEGVQEEAILAAQGWRYGQGWLFGKAAPPPGALAA